MAVKVWKATGFTDQDFGTAGNWVGGVAPVAGDDIYITQGSNNIDGTDETATALGKIYVGKEYTGLIGTSGSYLILDCSRLEYNGTGTASYISIQNGAASANIPVVVGPNAAEASVASLDSGGLHLKTNSTDAINPLRIRGGKTRIETGTRLSECTAMDGVLHIDGTMTGFTTLRGIGTAEIECESGPTGTLFVAQSANITYSGTTSVTAVTMWGGTVDWTGSADITTLTAFGGSFSGVESTSDWTITNQVVVYEATVNLQNGLGQPTLTAGYEVYGSGSVLIDNAAAVAVTYE